MGKNSKNFGLGLILKGPLGELLDDRLFNKGPTIPEKVNMLFKDVETDGKIEGYKRAASEYSKAFRSIETEYDEVKILIESQKNTYGEKSEYLIIKLSQLEQQKIELEKQVEEKAKEVAKKHNIHIGDLRTSLATGTLIMDNSSLDILGLIFKYKEKKLKEAEQRGYIEARELYEQKIEKFKNELYVLKKKGSTEIQELLNMIFDLYDAIANEQMKIADLKIVL